MLQLIITVALAAIVLYIYSVLSGNGGGAGGDKVALNPKKFIPFRLQERIEISHDTYIFRFALQSPEHTLGLPIGQHIAIKALCEAGPDDANPGTMKQEVVQHSYTPISSDDDKGYVDFLIKVYFKNVHPKFPNGGRLSQHLYHLPVGSTLEMCGPRGKFEYLGNGNVKIDDGKGGSRKVHVDAFAMVSGGTGITPNMQIIRAIQKGRKHPTNPDKTKIFLVYGNQTEKDILLRKELDDCVAADPNCKVWYTIDREPSPEWKYDVGYVSEDMFRAHFPVPEQIQKGDLSNPNNKDVQSVMALMCGPPPMVQYAIRPNLEKLGFTADMIFSF